MFITTIVDVVAIIIITMIIIVAMKIFIKNTVSIRWKIKLILFLVISFPRISYSPNDYFKVKKCMAWVKPYIWFGFL